MAAGQQSLGKKKRLTSAADRTWNLVVSLLVSCMVGGMLVMVLMVALGKDRGSAPAGPPDNGGLVPVASLLPVSPGPDNAAVASPAPDSPVPVALQLETPVPGLASPPAVTPNLTLAPTPARSARPRKVALQPPVVPSPPRTITRGKIYLVLDDAGYNQHQARRFIDLPVPFTLAVLPGLPWSGELASLARARGKETILHQPMEAVTAEKPDPGIILASMSRTEQSGLLAGNLDSLPGISGMNNHQGSRGTQDIALMRQVMTELKARKLYFLDSRTTSQSVAAQAAREAGVPFVERDVFLDNIADENEIRQALAKGLEIARKRGQVVMIGHVWSDELYDVVLQDWLDITAQGFSFELLGDLFMARNPVRGPSPEQAPRQERLP